MSALDEKLASDIAACNGPHDLAFEMVSDRGNVIKIEDDLWPAWDPVWDKHCFTRKYHFESGDVFEIAGQRGGHPLLEPLDQNPLVLEDARTTKAA